MKRIIFLLLLLLPAVLPAQYNIKPSTVTDGTTLTGRFNIQRATQYRWSVNCLDVVNANLGVRVTFQGRTTAVLPLEVIATVGLTQLTATTSGDSLMSWWLPDNTGSMGSAGDVYRALPGWLGEVVVVGTTGSNGQIAVADAVTLPSFSIVPTSDYLLKANRLRAGKTTLYLTDSLVLTGSAVSVTNSNGLTTATIATGGSVAVSDSLDINAREYVRRQQLADSLALRVKALSDSLLALRGQAAALYATISALVGYKDSTLEHSQYHAWTARQNFPFGVWAYPTATQTYADTNIFVTEMGRPPIKATDKTGESYIPFGDLLKWNTLYDNGTMINRMTGHHAYGWYSGLNPQGILGNKEALYTGIELWQDDQGYPFTIGGKNGIVERWTQFTDTAGVTKRTNMELFRRGDGRLAQSEWAADIFAFENGNGVSPVSDDSMAIKITPPRSAGATYTVGTFDVYNTGFRFNATAYANAGYMQAKQIDAPAAGYGFVISQEDNSGSWLSFGSQTQTAISDTTEFRNVMIGAKQSQLRFTSRNSRAEFIGMNSIVLPTPFRSDSTKRLAVDGNGVVFLAVDQQGAASTGVTATALRDSLDANARGYVAKRDSNNAVAGYTTPTQLRTKLTIVAPPVVSGADSNRAVTWNATSGAFELGWKGGAAGATVDTTRILPVVGTTKSTGGTLTLNGTLNVTGAGSMASIDSLVHGVLAKDTAVGWYKSDTGRVWRDYVMPPTKMDAFGASGTTMQNYKSGYIRYHMCFNPRAAIVDFRIASDTTNGVLLQGYSFKTRTGFNTAAGAYQAGFYHGGFQLHGNNSWVGSYYQTGGYNGRSTSIIAIPVGSNNQVECRFSGIDINTNELFAEIEVYFTMPAVNTSTYYVHIFKF